MERLIDATRIEQYILNNCSDNEEINAIYAEIINAPTVDAEPVRHGRWEVVDGAEPRRYGCSVCKKLSWTEDNYCSYCGAKMDEVEDEEIG